MEKEASKQIISQEAEDEAASNKHTTNETKIETITIAAPTPNSGATITTNNTTTTTIRSNSSGDNNNTSTIATATNNTVTINTSTSTAETVAADMDQLKMKNMLIVDPPSELRFVGPFTRPVITILKVTNPTEHALVFKIKTTAPKRYCVRPNFGTVLPHSTSKVEICLQPFVYDPNEKNKHKFMVQSLVIPNADTAEDINKIWKEAEPSRLVDVKLKCVFEMPAVSASESSGTGADIVKENVNLLSEEKILNLQSPEQSDSLITELRQLREENTSLRKENINLKEQVVRLRVLPTKPPMDEPYSPIMAQNQIPMFYIAISIAAAIFGILLGKYLL